MRVFRGLCLLYFSFGTGVALAQIPHVEPQILTKANFEGKVAMVEVAARFTCPQIKILRMRLCALLADRDPLLSASARSTALVWRAGSTPNNKRATRAVPLVNSSTRASGLAVNAKPE